MSEQELRFDSVNVMNVIRGPQHQSDTGNLSEWTYTSPRQILFLILNSLSILVVLLV